MVNTIYKFLDNELCEQEQQQLLDEIKINPTYSEILDREKSFRQFIKNNIAKRKVPPSLIQSIKDKIRSADYYR